MSEPLFHVHLKRNVWHRRLQHWVLGPDLTEHVNLCKYFWTTVGCVCVSPFMLTGIGIAKGIRRLQHGISKVNWPDVTISEKTKGNILVGAAVTVLSLPFVLVGFAIYESIKTFGWIAVGEFTGILSGSIGLIVVCIFSAVFVHDRLPEKPALTIEELNERWERQKIKNNKKEAKLAVKRAKREAREAKKPIKVKREPHPNLVATFVKAKKSKVCPYIEWKD